MENDEIKQEEQQDTSSSETVATGTEGVEQGGSQQAETPEAEAPAPQDLAEAFARLRESNKENNSETVGSENNGEQPKESISTGSTETEIASAGSNTASTNDDNGGFANELENFDSNSYMQGLVQSIQKEAANKAMAEFKEKNYRKITVMDLRQQDDQGNVTYVNPDNQRRPFESRMEAQQWVDSFNQQVDYDFRQVSEKYQRKLAEQAKPVAELISFAPTFAKMDKATQEVFDALIEPYEIKSGNQVIGYNCNLQAAASQAAKLASRFSPQQPTANAQATKQAAPVSQPAVDLKGSGSGSGSVGDPEPKNIAEAMALYQKQQKEKRNQ